MYNRFMLRWNIRLIIGVCLMVGGWVFAPMPAAAQVDPNLRTRLNQGPIIVDHTSLYLFDQIPGNYITSAGSIRLMLRHASVGHAIWDGGISCLQGNMAYNEECAQAGRHVPKYEPISWAFQDRGNPGYSPKIDDFVLQTQAQLSGRDIFMFKFCFIDYANPWCPGCTDSWSRLRDGYNQATTYLDDNATNKHVVWWTMPLTRYQGVAAGEEINQEIRNYVRQNNRILFDIADIESHTPDGNSVSVGGLEVAWDGYCSESGTNLSCHPVGAGAVPIAKGLWILMAQLAGWRPGATVTPSPGTTATPIPTTPLLTGDLDGDSNLDGVDLRLLMSRFNQVYPSYNLTGPATDLINIFDFNYLVSRI